jgi:hypothetical protein
MDALFSSTKPSMDDVMLYVERLEQRDGVRYHFRAELVDGVYAVGVFRDEPIHDWNLGYGDRHIHVSTASRCEIPCSQSHRTDGRVYCPSHKVNHHGLVGDLFRSAFAKDSNQIIR